MLNIFQVIFMQSSQLLHELVLLFTAYKGGNKFIEFEENKNHKLTIDKA